MSSATPHIPAEYIVPLNMNGLRGRLLRMPPPKNRKREILMVYGHHSSLERMYSLAQVIHEYGGVTMPDLPGFGGMDSFYKIGEKPDLDTMADYLASVIKLRYKGHRFTIAGISFGFLVVTRMLQRYPDIAKKVDLLISVVGFAHKDDLRFSKIRLRAYGFAARFFSYRLPALFFRNVVLHPFILRSFYSRTHNAKHKYVGLDAEARKSLTEFEIHLWHINEVRTYMKTTTAMLTVNNCEVAVDLPVWHIGVDLDNYFDNRLVEQHMRITFNDFNYIKAPIEKHIPNVIAGKEEASTLIPKKVRDLLKSKP